MTKPPNRYRPTDPREAAEQAFKAATTKAPAAPIVPVRAPVSANARETVPLKLDRDVIDFFQEAGPGWQERINSALRQVMLQSQGSSDGQR